MGKNKERTYAEIVNKPIMAEDWAMAQADPLTLIGREYYALLMKKNLERADLEEFLEKLAVLTFQQQEKVKEQILREVELTEELARERMMNAWVNSQLKNIPVQDMDPKTQSLMQDINNLLKQASHLMVVLAELSQKQNQLNATWNQIHSAKAHNILKQIKQNNVQLTGPDGQPINMTPEKEQQLLQALQPVTPAVLLKMNPYLVDEIEKAEEIKNKEANKEANKEEPNFVCANISKTNDLMAELGFHAQLFNDTGPLMGLALLQAIRKHKELFKNAGVTFTTSDAERFDMANKILEHVILLNQINKISSQLDRCEADVKEKTIEMKENVTGTRIESLPGGPYKKNGFNITAKPMPSKRRLTEEQEELLKKQTKGFKSGPGSAPAA